MGYISTSRRGCGKAGRRSGRGGVAHGLFRDTPRTRIYAGSGPLPAALFSSLIIVMRVVCISFLAVNWQSCPHAINVGAWVESPEYLAIQSTQHHRGNHCHCVDVLES